MLVFFFFAMHESSFYVHYRHYSCNYCIIFSNKLHVKVDNMKKINHYFTLFTLMYAISKHDSNIFVQYLFFLIRTVLKETNIHYKSIVEILTVMFKKIFILFSIKRTVWDRILSVLPGKFFPRQFFPRAILPEDMS
jgi:hypothetical protein